MVVLPSSYKAQQQDAPSPEGGPAGSEPNDAKENNEKVVDAEFEEVKEDNKES